MIQSSYLSETQVVSEFRDVSQDILVLSLMREVIFSIKVFWFTLDERGRIMHCSFNDTCSFSINCLFVISYALSI